MKRQEAEQREKREKKNVKPSSECQDKLWSTKRRATPQFFLPVSLTSVKSDHTHTLR